MSNTNDVMLNKVIEILAQKKQSNAKPKNKDAVLDSNDVSKIAKAVIDTYNALNDSMLETADVSEKLVDKYLKLIETTKAVDTVISDKSSLMSTDITSNFEKVFKQFEILSRKTNDASDIAKNFNLDVVSKQLKQTMSSAAAESADLGNKFEDEINKQLLTHTAAHSTTVISKSVDNFFERIKTNLQTPFKLAADIVQLPKKMAAGIKDVMSSVKNNMSNFKEGLNTGDFSALFMTDKEKDDQAKVGISNKAIDINKVLRFSTSGIATVWLFNNIEKLLEQISGKQLESLSNISEGQSLSGAFANGGIMGLVSEITKKILAAPIIGKLLTTLSLLAAPLTMLASAMSLSYFIGKNRLEAAKAKGETAEKVLNVKKATTTQKNIVAGSQMIAGDVGKGTAMERTYNGVKNAAIGGTIGTLLGGFVGSIIPGAGTAAGAIIGAKIGASVGGLTGIIGDKQLARGIDSLRLGFVNLYNSSGVFKNTLEKVNKVGSDLFGGFFKTLENIWNKIKGWLGFGKDDKSSDNPRNHNDPRRPHEVPNNFNINPDFVSSAVQYITANEGGGAGSVNKNDGGVGASVGSLNWNRKRLKELIDTMRIKDKATFDKAMGADFIQRFENHKDWSKKGIVFTNDDEQRWKNMMIAQKNMKPEDAKLLKVDEQIAKRDVNNYMTKAFNKGITDPRALLLAADYTNRHGSLPDLNGKTSFADLESYFKNISKIDAGRIAKPTSQKILDYWKDNKVEIAKSTITINNDIAKAKQQQEQAKADALAAQIKTNNEALKEIIKATTSDKAEADKNKTDIKTSNSTNVVNNTSSDNVPSLIINYLFGINAGGESTGMTKVG